MGAARKIEQSLRNEFFSHLQSLNFDFFSEKKVGDLMAHTVNDVETLKFACGLGVLVAYDGIFLLIFIFGAMLYISPVLTLYAFIPCLIKLGAAFWLWRLYKHEGEIYEYIERSGSHGTHGIS